MGGACPARTSGLSPDGKWLAYGISRSNGENELRVSKVADASTKAVAFGAHAGFFFGQQVAGLRIGYSETQQDKMRKDKKPVQNKLGLTNLGTGEQITIEGIQSFAFSPTGGWLAMRKYPAEKAGAGKVQPLGRCSGGARTRREHP